VVQDEIKFRGHPNVLSLHPRTLEITKENHLSARGDCIIGVGADKACADLDEAVRKGLKTAGAKVKIEIIVGSESFVINGYGDSRLSLLNENDIVIRKTHFVCPRTMSIRCDMASSDLPRGIVSLLQDSTATGLFRVSVE
jgi:hypothetical protein